MDLKEYQERARTTAQYPEVDSGSKWSINYCIVSLGGEVGELQNKWKKVLRGDKYLPGDGPSEIVSIRELLSSEIGDALWYLAMLAKELGTTLDEIAEMNLAKLKSRQDRGVVKGSGDKR